MKGTFEERLIEGGVRASVAASLLSGMYFPQDVVEEIQTIRNRLYAIEDELHLARIKLAAAKEEE